MRPAPRANHLQYFHEPGGGLLYYPPPGLPGHTVILTVWLIKGRPGLRYSRPGLSLFGFVYHVWQAFLQNPFLPWTYLWI